MDRIDLHIHTTASDGSVSPAGVAEKAAAAGLRAIAITDHDNAGGVTPAVLRGTELGLEVIPGVELSTDWQGHKAHLLGYFIDASSPALEPALNWATNERETRNRKMVSLMQADGFDISFEALQETYPGTVLGRPHMAEHLMRKGYVTSVKEAFRRYLGDGTPYGLPKRRLDLGFAVSCIRDSGGVAVLAHPLQYGHDKETLLRFIDEAVALGVSGLEAVYSEHSPQEEALVRRLAEERGLCITGGSDYHGRMKPGIELGVGFGSMFAGYDLLEGLKKAAGRS